MLKLNDKFAAPRPAIREDAGALAELINIAGEGLPLLVWEPLREPGETWLDVGRQRAARDIGGFSWRKADVVRQGDRVAAAIVSYRLEEPASPADIADAPAPFRPLLELENKVIGSWYVNALATFAEARGQGAATSLLDVAKSKALAADCAAMSLITGDVNPARRLYERFGFQAVARAAIVKDGWDGPGAEWILYRLDLLR